MLRESFLSMCELRAPESVGPRIKADGSFTGLPLIRPFTSLVAYPIAARNKPFNIRNIQRGKAMLYDFWISVAVLMRMEGRYGSEARWLLYRCLWIVSEREHLKFALKGTCS